jgi:hypothetical protein
MSKARDLANGATALSAVSATELGYLDGVTSAVQTQLNDKQAANAAVSTTELGYLDGVTSAIQTQLNQKPEYVAGKNAIINGGMDIWQRGTSFTYGGAAYCADRWGMVTSGPAFVFSRDSTTVPTGFTYSLKATAPSAGIMAIQTAIETANAIQYAGQNVTVSMYLATSNSSVVNWELDYSTSTDNAVNGTWTTISLQSPTTTTTMTRYSATFAVPSTAKSLRLYIGSTTLPTNGTINITGVQLELGSTATTFSRAGGTIQAELAACQRYYFRNTANAAYSMMSNYNSAVSTSVVDIPIPVPVQMRTYPSVLDYSTIGIQDGATIYSTGTWAISGSYYSTTLPVVRYTHGSAALTTFRGYQIIANNSSSGYIGLSAEL